MGGESASVPNSDDPQQVSEGEAPTGAEPEPTVGYGWEAEIDETEFGDDNDLDGQTPTPSIEDNSPDPTPVGDDEPAETPPPAQPTFTPPAAAQQPPAPPPAPPAPKPAAPAYASLPHDDSPVVREWTAHLLNTPVEQRQQVLASAPGDTGAKVAERLMALDKAHGKLRTDPFGFIGELAEQRAADLMEKSVFAERFKRLEALVLGKAGEEFLAKHKIAAPTERQEFDGLVRSGLDAHKAAEIVAMKRRLAELEGTGQRVAAKERQIEATKASARAQQSGKGKGRVVDLVSQRQKELDAAGTNATKIFQINEKYEKAGLPPGRLKRNT